MADKKERKSLQSPIGTATFVHLFEPHKFKAKPGQADKEPSFSVLLVFDDATARGPEMKALKKACVDVAVEKFGADALEKIKRNKIRVPWRDADDYAEYGEPFTDEGAVMINFKSTTAPGVVDRRARDIMNQKDVYAGCKMRVSFGIWPYDTDGSKGITLLLNNAQKTGEGKKLAGRADASEEFDTVDGDDDDGDDEYDGI